MRVVTYSGGAVAALVIMTTAIVVAFRKTDSFRQPAFLAFCLVGALGLSPVIKLIVQRPRPDLSPVFDAGGLAFPSGHATTSAIVFGSLAYVLTRQQSWRTNVWIWAVAGMLSFLIGFSRLYLGVHWTTDVVGGWTLGLMWVALGVVVTDLAWEIGVPKRADEAGTAPEGRPSATSVR
jgi:undecaprenyl-diphosphatase